MSDLHDLELIRARWRRALTCETLDTIDRDDFAMSGLAKRLGTSSARLLVLPLDPELAVVETDQWLWASMKNFETIDVAGRRFHLGAQQVPTAHAVVLVNSYGTRQPWSSYVAIHRSGAIEYGLGDRGAWERNDKEGNLIRVFNLISIVGCTWAMFKFATALRERLAPPGPYHLTVALQRTAGAYLGNVGEGWAEPLSWDNDLPPCADPHLLWHLELDDWPDDDTAQALAFRVGDYVEDAWGFAGRRYLARAGELSGRFDARQLRS
jgi:hypothetical protein